MGPCCSIDTPKHTFYSFFFWEMYTMYIWVPNVIYMLLFMKTTNRQVVSKWFFFKVGPPLLVGIPLWALHQPNSWIKPFQASSVSVFAWLCFLLRWWMTNCATGQPAPYVIMSKKTGSWFSFREFQKKFLSFNNKSSSCQVLLGVWYGGR